MTDYDKNTFIGDPQEYEWKTQPNGELSPDERQFWLEEAARWQIRHEDYTRYAEEALEKRHQALERLGMLRRIGKAAMPDMEREG